MGAGVMDRYVFEKMLFNLQSSIASHQSGALL